MWLYKINRDTAWQYPAATLQRTAGCGSEIVLIRRSCKPCFPNYLSKGASPLGNLWMCRNTAPRRSFPDKLNFPTCPPMDASQLGNSKCCPGWLMFVLSPSAGKFDCPTDLPRDASPLGKRPTQERQRPFPLQPKQPESNSSFVAPQSSTPSADAISSISLGTAALHFALVKIVNRERCGNLAKVTRRPGSP